MARVLRTTQTSFNDLGREGLEIALAHVDDLVVEEACAVVGEDRHVGEVGEEVSFVLAQPDRRRVGVLGHPAPRRFRPRRLIVGQPPGHRVQHSARTILMARARRAPVTRVSERLPEPKTNR